MAGWQKFMMVGNVGKPPEMRFTPNGAAVSNFTMAVSRTFTTNGEKKEETEWFSVVAWNKLAELVNQYLEKGKQIFVEGRLQTRTYEKEGQTHYRTEVVAENVVFLGPRGEQRPLAGVGVGASVDDDVTEVEDLPFD